METKTVHLTDDLLKGVSYHAKNENMDEYNAIKQKVGSIRMNIQNML